MISPHCQLILCDVAMTCHDWKFRHFVIFCIIYVSYVVGTEAFYKCKAVAGGERSCASGGAARQLHHRSNYGRKACIPPHRLPLPEGAMSEDSTRLIYYIWPGVRPKTAYGRYIYGTN